MSRWLSADLVALKKGEAVELDDDERVVSAEHDSPYVYLIVVKESRKRPAETVVSE